MIVTGPTIINVSGGRTSALMLRRVLDAHGGRLPDEAHAVFCNTGKELPETLDFLARIEREWNCPIVWLEFVSRRAEARYAVVSHATASRQGEPFDRLIASKRALPNQVMRWCTEELKLKLTIQWARDRGWTEWTSLVGLRADEPARVARLRARDHGDFSVALPLADSRTTKADVVAWWATQPFDLPLRNWESNCDACLLKGRDAVERIERDRPGTLDWWSAHEERLRATFRSDRSYASVRAAARLPLLPLALDPEDPALPCACTD